MAEFVLLVVLTQQDANNKNRGNLTYIKIMCMPNHRQCDCHDQ
jgi:hypothetical protein